MPNERHEAARDKRKHERLDAKIVRWYLNALVELASEGNQAAKIAYDALNPAADERGYTVAKVDAHDWAYNIHNNTWGTNNLAGQLKARVVILRIREGEKNDS